MSDHNDDTPVPRFSDSMPSLFSRAEAEYRINLDEGRAWQRLQSRLSTETRRSAIKWQTLAFAAAAVSVLGWAGWKAGTLQRVFPHTNSSTASAKAPTNTAFTSIRLAQGRSTLLDGTAVELTDGAEGTYQATAIHSSLEFNRGQLKIKVAHQAPGHDFTVKALKYEFVVLGTQFTVGIKNTQVALDVTEGRVAVRSDGKVLKVVELGGHWSNENSPPPQPSSAPVESVKTPAPSPSTKQETVHTEPLEVPSDPSGCRDLLRRGNVSPAEHCYLAIASGTGLSAEMSLFEVARLRRDVMGKPAAALAALDEYESRFASGTLAPEVRAARVDLLARSGRIDEALTESSQLLSSPSGQGRAVELRLLRGNLLRDNKHDCAAASLEYAQIESDPGPRGDQAQYSHAKCLQQTGHTAEAIQIYKRYLARPRPQHAEAAQKALEELQP